MKTVFRILVVVIVLGILGYFTYQIKDKLQVKKERAEMIAKLPDFKFYTLAEEKEFVRNDLKADRPVIIFHFNPGCENCQYEAGELAKNMNLFQNAQILMISDKAKDEMKSFMKYFKLDEHPEQVIPLWDKENHFFNYFGMGMYPLTIIYNSRHELVKYYKGEVRVETIHKAISE